MIQTKTASEPPTYPVMCGGCGALIQKPAQPGGTGYAWMGDIRVCYKCCAKRDRAIMQQTGEITLYLALKGEHFELTNWPDSLRFTVAQSRVGRHNIGRKRIDVWFRGPDDFIWHGVQVGTMNQFCRCKRTKRTEW